MRIAHVCGLLAVTILVALLGDLSDADVSEPVAAAYAKPLTEFASTTTAPPQITVSAAPAVEREPGMDAMLTSVGDLLATTTTTAAELGVAAQPLGTIPPPATTQPGSGTTTTTLPGSGVTTTTAPPPPPPLVVQGGPNSEFESQFASMINSFRSGSGLAGLSRDGSLDSRARSWSESMANNGGLSHSDLGSLLSPWSAAAENVGMGGSVDGVFGALAGSSGHKSNMLGNYTHFGVGVWVDSSGTVWTTHVFTG